jgi:Fe-S-cluster-containing hydrogenase component 2
VKLICGASYQDMPTIRRLVMLYALAGVDCVDVAADAAVVAVARQGLADAVKLAQVLGDRHYLAPDLPWLMISLNDSEDPHFRKAHFDAVHCPSECDRPCEALCPTAAIQFTGVKQGGVISNLCYGCGRCIVVCPISNIRAQFHQARPEDFSDDSRSQIDAIEIHTQAGRQTEFTALWQRLAPWKRQLKLISISCPDDPQIVAYLQDLYAIMAPLDIPLIWQTDGRPMSGDLGKGTTHATIRLAQKILAAELPGYVQLAGGTNHYTIRKLWDLGLVQFSALAQEDLIDANSPRQTTLRTVAGIAYGSYARTLVMPMLEEIEQELATFFDPVAREAPANNPGAFDKLGLSGASSETESIFEIDNTSTLIVGLNQARQLVRALKCGGV